MQGNPISHQDKTVPPLLFSALSGALLWQAQVQRLEKSSSAAAEVAEPGQQEFSELGQLCDVLLSQLRFSFRRLKRAKQPISWQD